MSNDSGEKTEQPTQKKIDDSRDKGQVSQSKEITTGVAILTIIIYYYFCKRYIVEDLKTTYEIVFFSINHLTNSTFFFKQAIAATTLILVKLSIVPVVIASIMSCTVNILQLNGIHLSFKIFEPDLDKFNPVTNAKNIFSKKNFIKFIKDIVQIIVLVYVAIYIFKTSLDDIFIVGSTSIVVASGFLGYMILKILIILLVISLFFGFFDFIMEKMNLLKQLMMTKEEIKEEYKNTDGNPEVKQERKKLHQELLEGDQYNEGLEDATMVLANPTHLAIVLVYSPSRWARPKIIMKAQGEHAQRIFLIAKKKNIPIIRDKWLVRSMYELVLIGEFIPNRFLLNVSDLISKNITLFPRVIYELKAKYGDKSVTTI